MEYGAYDNPQIKPHRPVANVFKIELAALFHLVKFSRLTAPTIDLRPSGNARLDLNLTTTFNAVSQTDLAQSFGGTLAVSFNRTTVATDRKSVV